MHSLYVAFAIAINSTQQILGHIDSVFTPLVLNLTTGCDYLSDAFYVYPQKPCYMFTPDAFFVETYNGLSVIVRDHQDTL